MGNLIADLDFEEGHEINSLKRQHFELIVELGFHLWAHRISRLLEQLVRRFSTEMAPPSRFIRHHQPPILLVSPIQLDCLGARYQGNVWNQAGCARRASRERDGDFIARFSVSATPKG
jgi:hypothetical protein